MEENNALVPQKRRFWQHSERQIVPPKPVKSNVDTGMLKIFACLLMLCDHMGKMIFPDAYVLTFTGEVLSYLPRLNILRVIGRLAMPMFAYGIAVGCNYTHNIWKYAFRLLLMGILVHPLYQEAMGHVALGKFTWNGILPLDIYRYYFQGKNLNILFTLGLGTLIIGGYRHRRYILMCFAILLTVALHSRIDYGYEGVFLIILFYAFLDRPLVSFVAVLLFFINWCMPRLITDYAFVLTKQGTSYALKFNETAFKRISSEIYALPSLLLIYLPIRKRYVKLPKRIFYFFYPAHLLLIYMLLLKG